MPYIAAHPELYEGKKVGTGQCVAYVQEASGTPSTATWTAGALVKSASYIQPGTAIATMVDNHYPNHATGNHAAIYISHDSHGIQVWDQWVGHPVSKRTLSYRGGNGSPSNDGDAFYVIE